MGDPFSGFHDRIIIRQNVSELLSMQNKSNDMVYVRQIQRDFFVLWLFFSVLLIGLRFSGAMGTGSVLAGIALSFSFTLFYVFRRAAKFRTLLAERTGEPAIEAELIQQGGEPLLLAKQNVLDAFGQPALIVEAGRIRVCNRRAAELFNLSEGQENGPMAALRHPGLLSACEHVMTSGGHAEYEWEPARNRNEYWRADITALGLNPLSDGVLLVMTDQQPVRKAEQARADFLANASHELRTPLTSISGFIETMKGPAKDDLAVWPRFIDIMDEQTRHMKDLIGDLLSLSRIELSGHLLPDTRLDIGLAVEQVLEALGHIGQAQNIELVLEKPETPLFIMGDEGELKQVVRNLVGNAMKYAPAKTQIKITLGASVSLNEAQTQAARSWAGAGRITLRSSEQKPGPAVWLQVRDDGPGIKSQYLPRLGERFFRVDDSRGGEIEGTGLGLAIVKHIVARHRGALCRDLETQSGRIARAGGERSDRNGCGFRSRGFYLR